jgi:hypothetical protein
VFGTGRVKNAGCSTKTLVYPTPGENREQTEPRNLAKRFQLE